MKKLFKDPLIHFLVLGVVLFIVYGFVNQKKIERNEIIIDSNDIDNFVAKWEMQWKRQPTQDELANLILQNIKQEVFYQEALKMNLDHNDEIIKRRLSQKMEFLSNDLAILTEPNDQELQVYLNKNSKKYLTPFNFSLYQIVFTYDNHDNPEKVIENILKTSENSSIDEMKSKGDNLPFPYYFKNTNSNELANQLGNDFIEDLKNLDLNVWVGPVSSGFGKHLVYITEKREPTLPDLNTIRDVVLRDFLYEKQKEIDEVIFKTLKNDYNITFDFENSQAAQAFKSFLESKLDN